MQIDTYNHSYDDKLNYYSKFDVKYRVKIEPGHIIRKRKCRVVCFFKNQEVAVSWSALFCLYLPVTNTPSCRDRYKDKTYE